MLKQIMIPVAALAVTVTTASAFTGTDWTTKLAELNLTDTEVAALEVAQEIRETAQEEAKKVLEDAGIDEDKMREIHKGMHEMREAEHEAIKEAVEANDFAAFQAATADRPFAENVDTAEEFAKLVEAHNLRESGDIEGAQAIMTELGFEAIGEGRMPGRGGHGMGGGFDDEAPE